MKSYLKILILIFLILLICISSYFIFFRREKISENVNSLTIFEKLTFNDNEKEVFDMLGQLKEHLLKDYENSERTIIIATHLIEEVANIIEEVVLIDKGKVLLQDNVNSLLETGFSVSGLAHEVDAYCADKNVIGYDELGNLKIAYVLGEKTPLPKTGNLSLSAMNLQKLFVKLTEKGDL